MSQTKPHTLVPAETANLIDRFVEHARSYITAASRKHPLPPARPRFNPENTRSGRYVIPRLEYSTMFGSSRSTTAAVLQEVEDINHAIDSARKAAIEAGKAIVLQMAWLGYRPDEFNRLLNALERDTAAESLSLLQLIMLPLERAQYDLRADSRKLTVCVLWPLYPFKPYAKPSQERATDALPGHRVSLIDRTLDSRTRPTMREWYRPTTNDCNRLVAGLPSLDPLTPSWDSLRTRLPDHTFESLSGMTCVAVLECIDFKVNQKDSKRGKHKLSEKTEQMYTDLLAEWDKAKGGGINRTKFCKDKGISVELLEKAQSWQRMRKTRGSY
jgi:hypothetical protein